MFTAFILNRRNMMNNKHWLIIFMSLIALTGCMKHPDSDDGDGEAKNLTVGTVQSEIIVGMPASDVATVLGSPNIVTTDEKRREVWIYDKVSTNRVNTSKSAFGTLIILGANSQQVQSTSSQKTLTIIIKYDENKMVRDFAYNYTQF
jgi:outer membrane protein assembly factor BamE (lipoprotein component of BamABCDE complex)